LVIFVPETAYSSLHGHGSPAGRRAQMPGDPGMAAMRQPRS
jgi:hypothetical protein